MANSQMELEVRLSRTAGEPWGFRLIGGVDFNMPLTVIKVVPNSPADQANLHNGDTVFRINGTDAAMVSHDEAKVAVAAATDCLELGVVRGLYDPVLDDFDPIYEPIDQEDFDQPSHPTEVFQIKEFTDLPDDPDFPSDIPIRSRTGSRGNPNIRSFSDSNPDRSLTESPFVLPTKPYRPFSTEPSPVPPLEDPIILNPVYHDEFGKLDALDGFEDAIYGETRFKLPISEQYDPDGTRLKKLKEIKTDEVTVTEDRVSEVKVSSVEERKIQEQKEEVTFMEIMKKEIDLDKIEITATRIVDESIERALTVADEIKKEVDLELKTATSEFKSEFSEVAELKSIMKTDKKKSKQEISELKTSIDESTAVIITESDVNVAKEVAKLESVDKLETNTSDQKTSIKQELQETIETGSVKSKSETYRKDLKLDDQRKSITETQIERKEAKTRSDEIKVKESSRTVKESEYNSETVANVSENNKSNENVNKETKYTTAKLLAEQRAYTIGLQTIPHIKGTIQSSYHYDLLLKTFFIHLTDVMVALSRFILAEPVLTKPLETKQDITVNKEVTEVKQDVSKRLVEDRVLKETKVEREDKVSREQKVRKAVEVSENKQVLEAKVEKVSDQAREENVQVFEENMTLSNDVMEKRMLSGAEMAQLSDKRSDELIHKMDGVITEFQVKAGLEEEMVIQRDRRSRSRSRIEEEVMKESDPLEWLSIADKKVEENKEVKTSKSILKSTEMKTESSHETKEITNESKYESKGEKSTEGKNTYIAIVEAHVYTNKNAILEEIAKTAAKQNIEEIYVGLEANKAMITERVAMESDTKQERAEVIESQQMSNKKNETVIVENNKKVIEDLQINVGLETNKAMITERVAMESDTKQERAEVIESQQMSSKKNETVIVEDNKKVIEDLQSFVEVEIKEAQAQVEIVSQPIIELHEDIVEKNYVSIAMKSEMDIQEMQCSEYVGDINVITEEAVETAQMKEFERVKVQDLQKTEEIMELQKISSIAKDEIIQDVQVFEENTSIKSESIAIAESQQVVQQTRNKEIETKNNLKINKEEIAKISENVEEEQEIVVNLKKSVQICEKENKYQTFISESSLENSEFVQESSFTAKSVDHSELMQESSFVAKTTDDKKNLTLDLKKSDSDSSVQSTINTPTPSTVPPTPLTDEYVFRLQMPLPKIKGDPIPRSPTPDDEDPHIVKKGLVPHIDTEIIEEVVYDTPLPTPPEVKVTPPVYTKPGLKGGNMIYMKKKKEEILEIERKSSLLASAIDETIKSIEEYKEEVGIDTNTEIPLVYNGYAKVIGTKVYNLDKDMESVEQQVIKNTDTINKIVENRDSIENKAINEREHSVGNGIIASNMDENEETSVDGYRPVPFNPEDVPHLERVEIRIPGSTPTIDPGKAFVTQDGEIIGTHQGIVDGLEEAVVDEEVAKELGKPGMTEEKIAELISGESEMLREAHVMGLSRVLKSHMHRNDDDSSVDFKKIKPIVESLKDSEVLKALNEEFMRTQEEKKKEDRKWTKFLQKPSRPVPRPKFGCHGYVVEEDDLESPYKVKIVKQPKPKIAPDYKPKVTA